MFIGVDGTGPGDPAEYARRFRDSFVSKLHRLCHHNFRRYLQGPTLDGLTCEALAVRVVDVIRQRVAADASDTRILLAGYSRGGSIVIRAAQMLQSDPYGGGSTALTVACMALFDSVDREPVADTAVIPGNVQYAYLARQDYESAFSRPYFYNWGLAADCGSSITPPGLLYTERFRATHAGMGGCPWTGDHPTIPVGPIMAHPTGVQTITEAEDDEGSARVWAWMSAKVRRHGMLP